MRSHSKSSYVEKLYGIARAFPIYVALLFLFELQVIAATPQETYPVTVSNYSTERQPVMLNFDKKPSRVIAYHQNNIEVLRAFHEEKRLIAAQGRYIAVSKEDKKEKERVLARVPYYGFYGID